METLIKDEFIVLKKNLIPDFDLSLTVYFRKQGKENIYIPKGQILKSPYIYYSEPFSWNKGVFNLRRNKIYIEEIDNYKNLSLEFTRDLKKFYTGYFFLNLFINYVSFPDEKLFILLKKGLYYLTSSKSPEIDKLNFLVKFIMLNGILPDFRYCQRCGTLLNEKNFYALDKDLISPVCKNCRKKEDKFYLSYRDIILIEKLKKVKFKELEKIKIEQKRIKKLIQFLNLYMKNAF
ncbi:MAG: DNA repair protein RecO [Persephonella sp.]|nr:MAG: DNA repair protein RecO [Persephonella sp.]